MEAWVIWLIAAVALTVGEIMSLSFFLAPFAAGDVSRCSWTSPARRTR